MNWQLKFTWGRSAAVWLIFFADVVLITLCLLKSFPGKGGARWLYLGLGGGSLMSAVVVMRYEAALSARRLLGCICIGLAHASLAWAWSCTYWEGERIFQQPTTWNLGMNINDFLRLAIPVPLAAGPVLFVLGQLLLDRISEPIWWKRLKASTGAKR